MAGVACKSGIIQQLREDKGLSQADLADQSGVNPKTLRKMEQGAPVRMDRINAIASVLGVGVDDLIDQEDSTDADDDLAYHLDPNPRTAYRMTAYPIDAQLLVNAVRQYGEARTRWYLAAHQVDDRAIEALQEVKECLSCMIVGTDDGIDTIEAMIAKAQAQAQLDSVLSSLRDVGLHLLSASYRFWQRHGGQFDETAWTWTNFFVCVVAPTSRRQVTLMANHGNPPETELQKPRVDLADDLDDDMPF